MEKWWPMLMPFIVALSSIFIYGIPAFFVIPYFLGKRFDRIMQQHYLSVPVGFGIMPEHIVRTSVYAINIVLFPNPKKHPDFLKYYRQRFGNFWFREHASIWDNIQAWYIVISVLFFIASWLYFIMFG
jgi:hypothetical protein